MVVVESSMNWWYRFDVWRHILVSTAHAAEAKKQAVSVKFAAYVVLVMGEAQPAFEEQRTVWVSIEAEVVGLLTAACCSLFGSAQHEYCTGSMCTSITQHAAAELTNVVDGCRCSHCSIEHIRPHHPVVAGNHPTCTTERVEGAWQLAHVCVCVFASVLAPGSFGCDHHRTLQ
jgi:hypothetical protein